MVARHRRLEMGHNELVGGGCSVQRVGGQRSRARRSGGVPAGQGERMGEECMDGGRLNEADGADCERVVQTRRQRDAHAARRISGPGGWQAVQARTGNGRWTESYPVGHPVASTSLTIKRLIRPNVVALDGMANEYVSDNLCAYYLLNYKLFWPSIDPLAASNSYLTNSS
jgi:hypothetical protein